MNTRRMPEDRAADIPSYLPRIAVAILFSVVASVLLISEGNVRVALLRWLLLVVSIGLLVNSQSGFPIKIVCIGSALSSLTMITSATFQAFLICRQTKVLAPPLITGANLCAESLLFSAGLLLFVLSISFVAVALAAIARPLLVDAINKLPRYALYAKRIEKSFRALILAITGIFIALALASGI